MPSANARAVCAYRCCNISSRHLSLVENLFSCRADTVFVFATLLEDHSAGSVAAVGNAASAVGGSGLVVVGFDSVIVGLDSMADCLGCMAGLADFQGAPVLQFCCFSQYF